MPLITFSFAFQTETKEGALSGNVEPRIALTILQELVIADAVKKAAAHSAGKGKTTTP